MNDNYMMGYIHAIDNYINLQAYEKSEHYKAGYDHGIADTTKLEEKDNEQF